jgi:hypothetical protein
MYAPVREARRLWHERYAEQLCLTAEDIAPWLIELPEPTRQMAARGFFPGTVSTDPAVPINRTAPAAFPWWEARGRGRGGDLSGRT